MRVSRTPSRRSAARTATRSCTACRRPRRPRLARAGSRSTSTCSRPARRRIRESLVVFVAVAPDVVGDEPLERLELLVELLGRDLVVGLVGPEDPRCGLDRRPPGRLLRLGARPGALRLLGRRRDAVEIDVLEPVALLLVVLDARAAPLVLRRLLPDRRAERRVLLAV